MINYLVSKENLTEQINFYIEDLEDSKLKYLAKSNLLTEYINDIDLKINSSSILSDLNELQILLHEFNNNLLFLKEHINDCSTLIEQLKTILTELTSNYSYSETIKHIDNFNSNYQKCRKSFIKKSFNLENFILEYTKKYIINPDLKKQNDIEQIIEKDKEIEPEIKSEMELNNLVSNEDSKNDEVTNNDEEVLDIEDNTLIISKIKNKVLLPFNLEDLKNMLKDNTKYTSIQKIIDEKYTLPLDKYKYFSLSRFKEAYKLMREREKAPFIDSIDLAFELTFNRRLNPVIITACRSLDQLDTYLDCLESNQLEKFNYFKIKYEILPLENAMHFPNI